MSREDTVRVVMYLLDDDELQQACDEVIDALSKISPEIKIGALHTLMESFPVPYVIEELPREVLE